MPQSDCPLPRGRSQGLITFDYPRTVSAHLEAWAYSPATIVLAIAASTRTQQPDELLRVSLDGAPVMVRELPGDHGGRLHVFDVVGPGGILIDYQATVIEEDGGSGLVDNDEVERLRYLRPSRYCESDTLEPFARTTFGALNDIDLVDEVSLWVNANIDYVAGASRPTDGATSTLLSRQGVCRDYAHLTTALLRARDLPARVVSVYAPGLSPMDFHAVTEVWVDGRWHIVDTTGLAPRTAMVRIATGADAADISFFTTIGGQVDFSAISIMAVADDGLPTDDSRLLTTLS